MLKRRDTIRHDTTRRNTTKNDPARFVTTPDDETRLDVSALFGFDDVLCRRSGGGSTMRSFDFESLVSRSEGIAIVGGAHATALC